MTHELLHQAGAGLRHASDASACGPGALDPADWPNHWGTIIGTGVRPSQGWKPIAPSGEYDIMSYCRDDTPWLSNFHWNQLVRAWQPGKATKAAGQPALAVRPGLRVLAALVDGSGPVVIARPVRAVPTPSDAAGTITVTAFDAAGAQLVSIRTVDRAPEGSGIVDVVLPIAEAARIEFTRDGGAPAVATRSASAPTVALTTLRGGARVGPKTRLRVAWRMADADGDPLRVRIDYSADNGRTWTPVASPGTEPSWRLSAGTLTTSARGLLRVIVSDGLRQSIAVSGRLRVTGTPPRLTLRTKGTLRTARRTSLVLSAFALDQTRTLLPASGLRWYEGKRLIGRGGKVTVRYTTKGTHTIRVVATDRFGLRTTKTLRVVVR
jgi:hypothetical protein